jgi:hypothetical protein
METREKTPPRMFVGTGNFRPHGDREPFLDGEIPIAILIYDHIEFGKEARWLI